MNGVNINPVEYVDRNEVKAKGRRQTDIWILPAASFSIIMDRRKCNSWCTGKNMHAASKSYRKV